MQQERIKSSSTLKGKLSKNLPTLRSSTIATKTIISLSKVDIDCRPPSKDRIVRASSLMQVQSQRTQSSFNVRKSKDLLDFKLISKTNYDGLSGSPIKNAINAIRQAREEEQAGQVSISIEKSKVSSKSYGIVRGYSANSHPGPVLANNEDRICIITNLTKTNVKQKQISFFGVYDGCRGVTKADYLRDNFHICLVEEESFPRDMEYAMRHTLKKLSTAFSEDPKYSTDQSSVSFAVIVIFSKKCPIKMRRFIICKAVPAREYFRQKWEKVYLCLNQNSRFWSQKRVQVLSRRIKGWWKEGPDIEYKCFREADRLDFVMLGSEGLFQNTKISDLGRRCWLYILKNKSEAIHVSVGQANNYLMSDVFSSLGSKNTSLILVAFQSVASCLEGSQFKEDLLLPYFPGWNFSQ